MAKCFDRYGQLSQHTIDQMVEICKARRFGHNQLSCHNCMYEDDECPEFIDIFKCTPASYFKYINKEE